MRTMWLLGLCGAAAPAMALPEDLFDFDGVEIGGVSDPLMLSGDHVDVVLNTSGAGYISSGALRPASWGDRSLLMNGVGQRLLTITFVGGVTGFEIEFGDNGGDVDTVVFSMYSGAGGAGSLLSSETLEWSGDFRVEEPGSFMFSFLAPTTALGSVVIDASGIGGDHSLYYDNLRVTVPAPGGLAVLGLAGSAGARRRRR